MRLLVLLVCCASFATAADNAFCRLDQAEAKAEEMALFAEVFSETEKPAWHSFPDHKALEL